MQQLAYIFIASSLSYRATRKQMHLCPLQILSIHTLIADAAANTVYRHSTIRKVLSFVRTDSGIAYFDHFQKIRLHIPVAA